MAELLSLLQAEGYDGYRDARGPMGFTQRQGNGKFTSDEADAYIAQMFEQAEHRDHEPPVSVPPARGRSSSMAERDLTEIPAEALAAELRRRGWLATAPPDSSTEPKR